MLYDDARSAKLTWVILLSKIFLNMALQATALSAIFRQDGLPLEQFTHSPATTGHEACLSCCLSVRFLCHTTQPLSPHWTCITMLV